MEPTLTAVSPSRSSPVPSFGVLWISAEDVSSPSGSPRHLNIRMSEKTDEALRQTEVSLVAAHRRRAAFLEQRCSRLAADLARVDQVREEQTERLRLKARDLQRRLDLAAAEREHHLHSMAVRCSERVSHAKTIAAQVRQQQAELRQLKQQRLQERLERSGVRRALFLEMRCMRSPSSPTSRRRRTTSEPCETVRAARTIQRWWRRRVISRAVQTFVKAIPRTFARLLRSQPVERLTFSLAQRLVASKDVMKPTQQLLKSLTKICPSLCADSARGSRVLLSAFVTILYPDFVFEAIGQPEEDLLKSAKHVTQSFGKMAGLIKSPKQTRLMIFAASFLNFQTSFASWKKQDMERLMEDFRRHWLQLVALKATVLSKDSAGHDVSHAQWLPNIERQQEEILKRVRQLSGQPGVTGFLASVSSTNSPTMEEMEMDCEDAVDGPESQPVDSDGKEDQSTAGSSYSSSSSTPSRSGRSGSTSQNSSSPDSLSAGSSGDDGGDDGDRPSDNSPSAASGAASSSPDILAAASNLELAHELIMDENFELKKNQLAEGSFEARVEKLMQQAFWDLLREELAQEPPVYDGVMKLLSEVKENLVQVLPPNGAESLRSEIEAGLDLPLISQQLTHGALNVGRCAAFVLSVMQRTCAPARDPQLQELASLAQSDSLDIAELFKQILDMLSVMRLDMANYQLRCLRPMLLQQSAEYERRKFAELFPGAPESLKGTLAWLTAAQEHLAVGMSPSSQPGSTPVSPLAILRRGYIDLVSCGVKSDFPETWWLDKDRLANIQSQLKCSALVQCVILLMCGAVGRRLSDDAKFQEELRNTLFVLLDDGLARDPDSLQENICEQVVDSVSKWLVSRGQPALDKTAASFLYSTIKRGFSPEDPVHHLLHSRLQLYLTQAMEKPLAVDSLPVPSSLSLVSGRLKSVVSSFARLTAFNQKVFGPTYNTVLQQIAHFHQ